MPQFELDSTFSDHAKIKVIGVGGAGGNALNTMIAEGLQGVDFIAANTDVQALEASLAPHRIQLGGHEVTRGLGAGANPERGREAALASVDTIAEHLRGVDMVFVTAGMGGGTGTGAAPIIAQVAREAGALTVGVVTRPFVFEGKRRAKVAEQGIEELQSCVDTLITISNQRLFEVSSDRMSLRDAFKIVDGVLLHATAGVSNLITVPGLINVDFADVRTIMQEQGRALMGMGEGREDGRAQAATHAAVNSPLLSDMDIRGAKGILLNITAGPDLSLREVEEAASIVQEKAHEDCNIIFGAVIDEAMEDRIQVTVIATGFDGEASKAPPEAEPRRRRPLHGAPAGLPSRTVPEERGPHPFQPRLTNPHHVAPVPRVQPPSASAFAAPQVSASQAALSAGWGSDDPAASRVEIPAYVRRQEEGGYRRS